MIDVFEAFLDVRKMLECSTSGVEEAKRSSDVIMLKDKGVLGSKRLVALGVESSVAGHLQRSKAWPGDRSTSRVCLYIRVSWGHSVVSQNKQ